MLSDSERERIREEEIFRHEVKKSLEEKPKKKFWSLLNTPFSIWFLSTIIIGIFSFTYAKIENSVSNRSKQNEKITALGIEASGRIQRAKTILNSSKTNQQFYIGLALLTGNVNNSNFRFFVFPEYESRNLYSILWELQSLVPKNEKYEITNSLRACSEISQVFDKQLVDIDDPQWSDTSVDKTLKENIMMMIEKDFSLRTFSTE